jgi:tetratricopeptide (TPR) repeat protein
MLTCHKYTLFILSILILGTGLYTNSFFNAFVYDDLVTVQENLFIRDWKNVRQFFTRDYYLLAEEYSFRPLVTLTYFWDYSWWRTNPWGYHLTNLLLHLLAGVTVFCLAAKLLKNRFAGWLAALFFVSHPVQTEAVNGISFREDLLCAVFFYLSFLFYLKSLGVSSLDTLKSHFEGVLRLRSGQAPRPKNLEPTEQTRFLANAQNDFDVQSLKGSREGGGETYNLKHITYYLLSFFSFVLALLSKEMAVSLPLIILAYELIIRKAKWKNVFRPQVLLFFAVALLYTLARFSLFYQRESLPAAPEFGHLLTRVFLVCKSLGLYGKLLFFPLNLTVEYPDPFAPVAWSNYLLVPAFLLPALCLAVWLRKWSPRAGKFGLTFFLLALLPILNLVPSARLGAERFLYLPILGFCLWGAALISPQLNRDKTGGRGYGSAGIIRRRVIYLLIGLVLISWSAGTIRRNRDWRNNLTLFFRAVKVSPESSKAHHGLGNEYFRRGQIGEAVREFKQAISIFPREPFYYNSLGVAYGEMGNFNAALSQFQTSARINPYDPLVLINLSTLYLRMGDLPRAEDKISTYISLRPDDPKGYLNRGEIYLQGEDYPKAAASFREALERDPDSVSALSGLGYCYFKLGDYEKARKYWEKALGLDPRNSQLKHNLKIISSK